MAPTESAILEHYLLAPSQLPSIVSLREFTAFFPRSLQSSPRIRSLYRDLQAQRNAVVESVAESIGTETKRGRALRRAVAAARREAESQEYDGELAIERALFGPAKNNKEPKHDLGSVVQDLENAVESLEAQLEDFQALESQLLKSVQQTVGSMSDLRYGRLANGQLQEQVREGLINLRDACKESNDSDIQGTREE